MDTSDFGLFDHTAGVDVSRRNLPHWFQPNVTVFLTFRTADSLPRSVLLLWDRELREWLRQVGVAVDPDQAIPDIQLLPEHRQDEFRQYRARRWNWHLDSCYGECTLRRRDFAEVVSNSIRHFDGERYDLDSFVVMPNHVHLLAQFRPPTTCRGQSTSWMRFTAREINSRLERRGEFWQGEPFDHLVRSADQFETLRRYIAENGPRARLRESDYLYWSRAIRPDPSHVRPESLPPSSSL